MNRKPIIIAITLIFILIVICLVFIHNSYTYFYTISTKHSTQEAVENLLLYNTSKKIGVEPSWLAVRDYVYCQSLHKGMTREEIETTLSQIGRINSFESSIDFLDNTLSTKLGPIVLVFNESGPHGKLTHWRRSPDQNLGQLLAECEIDQ